MSEKDTKRIQDIMNEIDGIKLKLDSLKLSLQNMFDNQEGIELSVYQIRRMAILEEVHRKDGIVTSEQLSEITKRWGRNPQGTAGYFSGDNPSLRGIAGGKRALTERGLEIVMENRQSFGDDWLDRVDINFVGNSNTPVDAVIKL